MVDICQWYLLYCFFFFCTVELMYYIMILFSQYIFMRDDIKYILCYC